MKCLTIGIMLLGGVQLAAAQGLPVDTAALVAGVDSFVLRVQDTDVGWQRFTLDRTAAGFVITEETITPEGGQQSRVELDAHGLTKSVQQTGSAAGARMAIDLSYAAGRVRGSSLAPPATAATAIDTEVPAGVVDDNALFSLLPALPWQPAATWHFPMFSAGKNELREQTLRVTATETVTVPAGSFEAYRAELETDGRVVVFHVTVTAPHRVVRVGLEGTPLEFVRAK